MKKHILFTLLFLAVVTIKAQDYLMVADVMPKFGNGGYSGITNYLDKNIEYPLEAYFNNKQGEVNIRFVIKNDGKMVLMSPAYMKTLGYGLEGAAMKAISSMPTWTPGIQDGKKVNVWVFLPYHFKLPNEMPYFNEAFANTKSVYTDGEANLSNALKISTTIKDFNGIDIKNPVLLDLFIDTTGQVTEARINPLDSSIKVLHSYAKEAAMKLNNFSPAAYKGKKIRVIKTIAVDYSIPIKEKMEIVKDIPQLKEKEKIYSIVEQPATYPGGMDEMAKFIQQKLNYPDEARYNDKSGTVWIEMTIDTDGKVINVQPKMPKEKQLGYGLEQEAIRVLKLMPNWIPAEQAGEKVIQKFTIPIQYELVGNAKKKRSKKKKR